MERFPKRKNEETDEEPSEEVTERLAAEVEQMTPEQMKEYASAEMLHSQEKIQFQTERIEHLKAQIERLKEQVRSAQESEKQFFQEQLSHTQMLLDEYLADRKEEEDEVTDIGDMVEGMEGESKKHLN